MVAEFCDEREAEIQDGYTDEFYLRTFTAEDLDLKGEIVYYRFTFFNNENGTVRQLWESSVDKIEWRIVFDGLYKKRL